MVLLVRTRIKSGENWIAMLVCPLHKSSYYFSVLHNYGLALKDRVFSMQKLHISLLCDIKKSTNILFSLFVVGVHNCSFMWFFNENVWFRSVPKCVPNFVKWYLFDKFTTLNAKILNKWLNKFIFVIFVLHEPLSFFFFGFKIKRFFYPYASCISWVSEFRKWIVRRKEELPCSNTDLLHYTVSSE